MQDQISKRAFFRGKLKAAISLRPPGAVEQFAELCTRCDACLTACPTGIIGRDPEGLPKVDLSNGACLFCGECAEACEPQAILPATSWAIRAKVNASCLSFNGVMCRTCEDHCDHQAIHFHLMTRGRSVPTIDPDRCTGCGECAAPCPSQSIQFYEQPSQRG